MNNYIIKKYINKLTKQDIINYITKENINLSQQELDTIYYYIKNKSDNFLNGHQQEILKEIKNKVSFQTYQLIEEYYNKYKERISKN